MWLQVAARHSGTYLSAFYSHFVDITYSDIFMNALF
jgi:hypothetical protein